MISLSEAAQKTYYLQRFFLCILQFFLWVEEGGWSTLRATPVIPKSAVSLCVCGEKASILQEEFNTSKASCVLALYHEYHLQDAACTLALGWKRLVWCFGEQMSSGLETSLQLNPAICSSRLKLRQDLAHRQAPRWRWTNSALFK